MSVVELFELAKKENWKICVYGLGKYAQACCERFLSYLEIMPNYICDKNEKNLQKFNLMKAKKINIDDLKKQKDKILLLLFMSSKYEKDVYDEFRNNNNISIINWEEIHILLNRDNILSAYFGINDWKQDILLEEKQKNMIRKKSENSKIAVYTCITDNYDKLNKIEVKEDGCDYYLITDQVYDKYIENEEYYKKISVYDIVPKDVISPKDQNRYCKSHGAEIFKDYDYTIYLDGNIKILKNISTLVTLIGNYGLALHKHPFCNDAYLEAFSLSVRNKINKDEAIQTMRKFAQEGFTRNYGMAECGIIICDNKNKKGKEILDRWYKNYNKNVIKRDQIYFAYTLWELRIKMSDVCTLPGTLRTNGFFCISANHINGF